MLNGIIYLFNQKILEARFSDLTNQEVILDQLEEWLVPVIRGLISELYELKDLGITGSQFHLLNTIHKEKVSNVKRLAEELDVKSSAITVMLERLVQSGLVSRVQDESDRRSVLVTLTDAGEEVLVKAKNYSRDILMNYARLLDEDEQVIIQRVIKKFADYQSVKKSHSSNN
ncbi:MarR family transcriptional regulator [Pradoshia eiseniae]|uniref:MarR family transcriptional regulator n=1 Tax=Pradoshia eiseniae TaxID=2064768 RepID=A0A2S7N4Y2_9BACI|nr:MarR family transcriptional regulator [Pradoshia eiseniae]